MTLHIDAERADPNRRRRRPRLVVPWTPPEPRQPGPADDDHLRHLSDEEVLLVPPVPPDPAVTHAHDVADDAEETLRRVLGDKAVTARAVPSWGRERSFGATVSVELPVTATEVLVESVRRVVELGERRPRPRPLPPEDDWLLAGGWWA